MRSKDPKDVGRLSGIAVMIILVLYCYNLCFIGCLLLICHPRILVSSWACSMLIYCRIAKFITTRGKHAYVSLPAFAFVKKVHVRMFLAFYFSK